MSSNFFLVIYAEPDFSLAEELGKEISSALDVEYALGSYDNLGDTELSERFLVRSCQKMAESLFVLVIASDELFENSILSQVAKEAVDAKKALFVFLPSTKNFPDWFSKPQSIRLASDTILRKPELNVAIKKARSFIN